MDRREAIKRTSLLLGGALSASAITGIMQGCQPTGALDWEPVFLSSEEASLVTSIADCILPATDTPSASDVFVPEFIDLMLQEVYSSAEQTRFRTGLKALEKKSQEQSQKPFGKHSSAEQTAILTELETAAASQTGSEKPFIRMIKELSLLGYFTSDKIMQEVLSYNPVPGKYEGCVDMAPDAVVSVDNNIF